MSSPREQAGGMSSGNTYPVKRVRFSGKRVPILLQDVNGPCPLIALANVLFLRGKVDLPAGAGEVDAERVTQLLVGYFLDANPSEGRSEEVQVALHRQLEEAINLLPKLSTGIDVNVRFTTTDGFEFTSETGLFDLMHVQLVHGWLVDPQDATTAEALGTKSYNELIAELVSVLEGPAPPQETQQDRVAASPESPAPTSGPSSTQPVDIPGRSPRSSGSAIGADALRRALVSASASVGSGESPLRSQTLATDDSLSSTISQMLSELVKDAFSRSHGVSGALSAQTGSSYGQLLANSQVPSPQRSTLSEEPGPSSTRGPAPAPAAAAQGPGASEGGADEKESIVALSSNMAAQTSPFGEPGPDAASSPGPARHIPDADALQRCLVVQQFLESCPSQLTYHGLSALQQDLGEGELAVFFRNNHFNVLHKREGQLYLLVTDQGYQYESDVVWEHLASVDGDTALLDADFRPFQPHGAAARAGSTSPGEEHADADFALAMALQQQEEEEARRRRERAARTAEARPLDAQLAPLAAAAASRRASAEASPSAPSPARPQTKHTSKSTDCVIM